MLGHALRLRCPRCGAGGLYSKPFTMNEHCAISELLIREEFTWSIPDTKWTVSVT
jgi:uncharacterized protein (DUF983 family)